MHFFLKKGPVFFDFEYINIEFGTPDSVDISNPLQVLLFYKFFNKIIVLDNRLNLISSHNIPLNTELIANASDGKIWIYNNNQNTLSLYNFSSQKTEITSNPLFDIIINLKGDLNSALAITNKQELLTFNYVASKTHTQKTTTSLLPISLHSSYVVKNDQLLFNKNVVFKDLANITAFEVVNNTLYYIKEHTIYKTPILSK